MAHGASSPGYRREREHEPRRLCSPLSGGIAVIACYRLWLFAIDDVNNA